MGRLYKHQAPLGTGRILSAVFPLMPLQEDYGTAPEPASLPSG